MAIEIDINIENFLFFVLFVYCVYLLFFSFSYSTQEGLKISTGDSNDDENDNSNDDGNTYKTTAPDKRKDETTDGIDENSSKFIKHLKYEKEDALYHLNIRKYKSNYKKIVNNVDDYSDIFKLNIALQTGLLFPGTTKSDLLKTIDKYS